MANFLSINKIPNKGIPISEQRRMWLREFLKAFLVVFITYMCMYLIRNNFKAAQPMMKEQLGFSTTELGVIGLAFSITYGLGKTAVGYYISDKNTKKSVSCMLIGSSICVLIMGILFSSTGTPIGLLMALWGLSGVLQSAGGPASYSTISRWAPRQERGRYLGFWNMSHNIGGALAGGLALWGANLLFNGNVYGMFIFPAVIALIVGIVTLFIGKDDPEELGWNRCEEIFEEPVEEENKEADEMPMWPAFKKFVLTNPWIWMLCFANVFVYIVRIGIDNWAPLYVTEALHFSKSDAVNTIAYFEFGAVLASMSWGYISDKANGRRAAVAVGCLLAIFGAVYMYRHATSVFMVNASLFLLGALIFGPQLLIGISLVGFVPKKGISVANGMTGTFGYLFGDSMAKVGVAAIADPKKNGLEVFGHVLHGWQDVFTVFYAALVLGIVLLTIVAFGEEKRIREVNAKLAQQKS
ncbi:hexose-6-phosphate:phosphate antiporter [Kingella negevensis]|uniref:Hexose phosphate transport protein n=1 Tax=Kingella negevensis TaxID=1522312 RepID=A0A238HF14_9NEIS|nr:hexose-6-phosphate:phosphate antiporter [Kingella negevensis]MDK4679207.1 hexose-6-phosphate:phosphate antiporter [Kingella negevensis]MDK4683071.1 hexose-6-phosphate:phosphate antiporter [Kingella negevensis]MDK4683741.1 hexose-6-phosphate:phosphate antiporter [Kingella negevensis]MDK4688499.1 hexose-6-phosphate:phosphate antiporter [Kingella negevensis]MDK4691271.1 hexose-6-phosphate:phosphate antiporter [Kingella negevensis]